VSRAFRVERPAGGIAHLVMDDPNRPVNVLDEAAIGDLETALTELESASGIEGVIVRSGKAGTFIAGADVEAIGAITDREVVRALVLRAHRAYQRLADLPVSTVAAIDGVCLGGGTELALACDSRVAAEEPRTQIGLPEVMLGILPAFGGTTRLPRLVGLSTALDLILTGRSLDAKRAERAGLVWRAVPAAWLIEWAARRVGELRALPKPRRRDRYRPKGFGPWFVDQTPFGRALAFGQAKSQTRARTGGHYPAPLAILRVLEHGIGRSVPESLALEAGEVGDLVVGPVCKNLVRIFRLSERAKKAPVAADRSLEPAPIRNLALVGAGVMGGGIAELASRSGIEVRVRDLQPAALTRTLQTARGLIEERNRKRRAPARDLDAQMARIYPTLDLSGFGRADAAIEAVVEDLDVKRRVFAELEARLRPDAVLATNTSSLSVDTLASGVGKPERFVGFHFFNPVHRMPLVEVVRGAKTSDATLVTAVALARRLGKTPVVVNDAPGFVVNRILMPYMREALHLLEEGFPLAGIDAAMRRFGMPMGPFEVADEVGLDVANKVAHVLAAAFPSRMSPAPLLEKLIAAGRLGKKNGRGFYLHGRGRRRPDPALPALLAVARERRAPSLEVYTERMVLAMINEAAHCLEEGVVADAGLLDLAMIFGAGFPPYRGGLMRHADTLGVKHVEARLQALAAERGPRFAPAKRIAELAARGGTFTAPVAAAAPAAVGAGR
jgi:3-hydroxyacyl-CoA dehydrogenase/enoyl-CoA hydratase/3-hydroxybutyryl-CoA epimerase